MCPYRETWEKVNLTFHDNGTLTYNQQKVYRFDPEQSVGSEDDIVVVPNIPMLVSYTRIILYHPHTFTDSFKASFKNCELVRSIINIL